MGKLSEIDDIYVFVGINLGLSVNVVFFGIDGVNIWVYLLVDFEVNFLVYKDNFDVFFFWYFIIFFLIKDLSWNELYLNKLMIEMYVYMYFDYFS